MVNVKAECYQGDEGNSSSANVTRNIPSHMKYYSKDPCRVVVNNCQALAQNPNPRPQTPQSPISPVGVTCGDVPLQGHRHCGQQRPVLDDQSHRVQEGQHAGEQPEIFKS